MNAAFYIAGTITVIASLMAITRRYAIHALLYLIVSLLSLAVVFFVLGAPFAAALEVIIYAGAIMVLFVFVVMMLNLGSDEEKKRSLGLSVRMWLGPVVLSLFLLAEFLIFLVSSAGKEPIAAPIGPKAVGISLFGKYVLGVEIVALLLLAGIIGAYHLGRQKRKTVHRFLKGESK
jgi:NADH-quinone oxidoreductase subunit J